MAAPKQWALEKSGETLSTFNAWKDNFIFRYEREPGFKEFFLPTTTWKSSKHANRGLNDIAGGATGVERSKNLTMLLRQLHLWCPHISRGTIVDQSTSMSNVWNKIREHYGIQTTGAHFLDIDKVMYSPEKSYEDIYQEILCHFEDNLVTTDCGITHHGEKLDKDEEMTPSMENVVVYLWLKTLHPNLPSLIKQKYGTEIRGRTLASIKSEISLALPSLLEEASQQTEIRNIQSRLARTNIHDRNPYSNRPPGPRSSEGRPYPQAQRGQPRQQQFRAPQRNSKLCKICELMGRDPHQHWTLQCPDLPSSDRRYLSNRVRAIASEWDEEYQHYEMDMMTDGREYEEEGEYSLSESTVRRVGKTPSPMIEVHHNLKPIQMTIDSGSESNLVSAMTAKQTSMPILKTFHRAFQADGTTPLDVIGETNTKLIYRTHTLEFDALVVRDLDVPMIGGQPFLELNDVSIRPSKKLIAIGHDVTTYADKNNFTQHQMSSLPTLQAEQTCIRVNKSVTVWPGDSLSLTIPGATSPQTETALQPSRTSFHSSDHDLWPPADIYIADHGHVTIRNDTNEPLMFPKHAHICNAYPTTEPTPSREDSNHHPFPSATRRAPVTDNLGLIKIDPNSILPEGYIDKFRTINAKYASVFDGQLPGYNGASGNVQATVNMGKTPPQQRRAKLPLYPRQRMQEFQDKADQLELQGILAKPEDVGVTVEYVNPSFLVNSSNPNKSARFVTAFTDIGQHAKIQPTLIGNCEKALHQIGQWKYMIITDFSSSYFQIPLSKESQKYCGISTPYRGTRVYVRAAMGMPGSEAALEEILDRVLGDYLASGKLIKVADDVFCGSNSLSELLQTWEEVLAKCAQNNLRLSPSKTLICPSTAVVLGWVWSFGSLSAGSHRIATLASCSPPKTAKNMRTYVGSYKFISRVYPNTAKILAPLEAAVIGLKPADKVEWTDTLLEHFRKSQEILKSPNTIAIPRPTDELWIVTDGSTTRDGLGATLYLLRQEKMLLGGFFSAKLKAHQNLWLPCEIEALAIATAVKHFSPYIIESTKQARILTDSKPCVEAYKKLQRGEFSSSPRLTTFLSTISRFQVTLSHIAGQANLISDFASRNAPDCDSPTCQICNFVGRLESASVLQSTTADILQGKANAPFANRPAWREAQMACPDIRRAHGHLKQGTKPGKKATKIPDVKRYINAATIASDNLLIVRKTDPFCPTREAIVIPRTAIEGLLTALHLRLSHPTKYQLRQVFTRFFFALDLDQYIQIVTEACHTCASLKRLPTPVTNQSSALPPTTVGTNFAADVFKLRRQSILLLRETVTSFTVATSVSQETEDCLYTALTTLVSRIRPVDGPTATIRVDPAPGFQAIFNKNRLKHLNIILEIGDTKNVNKNPVAEHAIDEIRCEIKRLYPDHGYLTMDQLELVCQRLNSRIRFSGLSSYEMMFHREQYTNQPIHVNDLSLIQQQQQTRQRNHLYSEHSKLRSGVKFPNEKLQVGDLVYLYADTSKLDSRPRYLVTTLLPNELCEVKKLTSSQFRNKPYRIRSNECYKVKPYQDNYVPRYYKHLQHQSDNLTPILDTEPRHTQTVDITADIVTEPVGIEIEGNIDTDNPSNEHLFDIEAVNRDGLYHESLDTPDLGRPKRRLRPSVRMKDYVLDL